MKRICKDETEIVYYACDYVPACLDKLPWKNIMFDCIIFPDKIYNKSDYQMLVDELLDKNIDWIFTCEPDSSFWHDYIDNAAVSKGLQVKVGDGHPMTAWFEEIKGISDWGTEYNHGGCDNFLFLFLGYKGPIEDRIEIIKNKIKAE